MKWFHLGQPESQTVDTFTGTKALMILINQKWWTVCFCWLSRLQHSCIHHRKILRWQESFTTCQVLHRTGDLRDSQISDISGGLGHITLEASRPAPATSINYPLLMLKNVQFPPLLMKSSDVVLKFHDLKSFAFWGGVIFAKVETWIHHFLSLWTKTCIPSGVQSSTFVQSVYVRSQWWKPTQNSVQRHTKM